VGSSFAIDAAAERLAGAGCVAARDEACELVAAFGGGPALHAAVARRAGGEPLAWITGSTRFCGRAVRVVPGVYVPRPHTEDLARRAAARLAAGGRAADLCTGSGAVGAHLARCGARVVGVDIDRRAARCAARNGVDVVVADAAAPPLRPASFDVVTAVAPYVPTSGLALLPRDVREREPRCALDGGADGLSVVGAVVVAAAALLRPGGWLLVELGAGQDVALAPALADAGFGAPDVWWDVEGDVRGLAARRAVGTPVSFA
jgi:release factor glutamine methyltransferase